MIETITTKEDIIRAINNLDEQIKKVDEFIKLASKEKMKFKLCEIEQAGIDWDIPVLTFEEGKALVLSTLKSKVASLHLDKRVLFQDLKNLLLKLDKRVGLW